jgi:hypothetical protein
VRQRPDVGRGSRLVGVADILNPVMIAML